MGMRVTFHLSVAVFDLYLMLLVRSTNEIQKCTTVVINKSRDHFVFFVLSQLPIAGGKIAIEMRKQEKRKKLTIITYCPHLTRIEAVSGRPYTKDAVIINYPALSISVAMIMTLEAVNNNNNADNNING